MAQPVFVSKVFIARSSRGVEVLFASAAAVDPANSACVCDGQRDRERERKVRHRVREERQTQRALSPPTHINLIAIFT